LRRDKTEIVQHRRVALLELMQKHIRQRDLSDITESLAAVVMPGMTVTSINGN
jgi:predicted transposase YdaD